jgi:sulfatase modifying factor 1
VIRSHALTMDRRGGRAHPARAMRWGVRVALLAVFAVLTTSCVKVTRLGGLLLWMTTDGSLQPDSLFIEVTSPDGTTTYRKSTYKIPADATFPTSLAIVSNGDPTAAVAITASVSAGGVLLDRQDLVLPVPTDEVQPVRLVFSANCSAKVSFVNGVLTSKCGDGGANPPLGEGGGTATEASPSPEIETGPSPGTDTSPPSEDDGGDATAATADAGLVAVCAPNATQCSGNAAQTCINGEWQTTTTCGGIAPFCFAGACSLEPPSCLVRANSVFSVCGSANESCCTSLEVTGGTFYRTYMSDPDGGAIELTAPATISSFKLDKYDVTVGRFRPFVAAWSAGYRPAPGSGKHAYLNGGQGLVNVGAGGGFEPGWVTTDESNVTPAQASCGSETSWTSIPTTQENLPMNCVNWYEAYAFCIWDGGFLPSDAEFEYAAAGGKQQREYPWGSTPPGPSDEYAIFGCFYGPASCDTVASIAPVGTAPAGAGLWGQNDLAGEVVEWNLDWANLDLPYVASCSDCAQVTATTERVVRGSSFYADPSDLVSTFLDSEPPYERDGTYGFRCARAP